MKYFCSMMAVAASAISAQADASYIAGRPCADADLRGLWKNVGITERPAGAVTETFKRLPHEYMVFTGNGRFAYQARATEAPAVTMDEQNALVKEVVAGSAAAGSFSERFAHGVMILEHDGAPWANFVCMIAQADSEDEDIKVGDMVWYSPEGQRPYLKRVERRLSRPQ